MQRVGDDRGADGVGGQGHLKLRVDIRVVAGDAGVVNEGVEATKLRGDEVPGGHGGVKSHGGIKSHGGVGGEDLGHGEAEARIGAGNEDDSGGGTVVIVS